mmetsp:Transcript_54918/g.97781  ORF Transcript_54918/g.97781 Transcript_54918/m.97781 type:complete len:223 (+) Transcript_54918:287-955(+)
MQPLLLCLPLLFQPLAAPLLLGMVVVVAEGLHPLLLLLAVAVGRERRERAASVIGAGGEDLPDDGVVLHRGLQARVVPLLPVLGVLLQLRLAVAVQALLDRLLQLLLALQAVPQVVQLLGQVCGLLLRQLHRLHNLLQRVLVNVYVHHSGQVRNRPLVCVHSSTRIRACVHPCTGVRINIHPCTRVCVQHCTCSWLWRGRARPWEERFRGRLSLSIATDTND